MRAQGVEACLLFHEANIRYATGASAMPVWSMTTFVRCTLVPVEGHPILFEHDNSVHRSRLAIDDVRPMHVWEFHADPAPEAAVFARQIASAMRELGLGSRLAIDRLGTPGFLALQALGIEVVDAMPVTQVAREVKTPEELQLFRASAPIVAEQLRALEAAIEPGIRERELLAIMAERLLAGGGEYLATNTVCSGPNTNPWRAEATDRAVEAGDLVYVDTDSVVLGGSFFCVSRTFLCGDVAPTRAQRETYRAAHDWLGGMRELLAPGISCAELAVRAPSLPERYLPQRYECMVHGAGLEEESPTVCYPIDRQPNADRILHEGMVLVAELYAGESGGRDGVKLGDQVIITADGPEVLVPYPFSGELLS